MNLSSNLRYYWGEIFFLFYFIMASIYFRERTLFLDNALQIFLLIQDGYIEINANRWPAVINRFLPLAGVKLGLSLPVILYLFSISYVLVQFVLYKLVKLHNNPYINLCFISILSLPVYHGFFWCNSELVLGILFVLLWYVTFLKHRYLLAALISSVIAWTHPLLLVVFSYFIVQLLVKKKLKSYRAVISISVFYLNYYCKETFYPNWYDNIKSETFQNNLEHYPWHEMLTNLTVWVQSYWWISILLALTIILLIIKKQWLQLGILAVFTAAYGLLLSISALNQPTDAFYSEVNHYIIYLFIFTSIYGALLPKNKSLLIPIIALMCLLVPLINWTSASQFYKERIDWYTNILVNGDRLVIDAHKLDNEHLVMPWASAYESLLLSSISGDSKSILISNNPQEYQLSESSDLLLTEFRTYPLDSLNKRYFKLDCKPYSIGYLD